MHHHAMSTIVKANDCLRSYETQSDNDQSELIVMSLHLTDSSLCLFRAVFSLPGHSLPLLYTDLLCLLRPWSRTFFCFASASKVQLSR